MYHIFWRVYFIKNLSRFLSSDKRLSHTWYTFYIGSSPTKDIDIGGQRISCLLDTGSTVSTIIESFCNSYLHDIPVVHEKLITLRAANGIEIPYVGYMRDKYYSEALESCYVYDWYTHTYWNCDGGRPCLFRSN